MADPLSVDYDVEITEEGADEVEDARRNWEQMNPDDRAVLQRLHRKVQRSLYGKELEEVTYKEFLHPRGRGGKWIRKLGGPAQATDTDAWEDFKIKVRTDPFFFIEPGDDPNPVVNALHQIDSGWTMKISKNRDELPSGSLPEGVDAVVRFDKQVVEPGEPPDSLVLYTQGKSFSEAKIVQVGHGSMVWDHMLVGNVQRAEEVRLWKLDQAKIAAERADREKERIRRELADAEAKEKVRSAVTRGDEEGLRVALGDRSADAASALMESAGLQHRERRQDWEAQTVIDTLRGQHGETVTVTTRKPKRDSFKQMEEGTDRALDPDAKLTLAQVMDPAIDEMRAQGDRRPDDPEGAKAWRARRDALAERLMTQRYTWVGRVDTGQREYPGGLWAVLEGEDHKAYTVDWGGNLHSLADDEPVIEGPRVDRRIGAQATNLTVAITPNPQGGRRDRLPQGQAPKNVDELLVDTLGRADELGRKYNTGVNVQAVVHDIVPQNADAVHEWNGTISIRDGFLQDAADYLETRAYAATQGLDISDQRHLSFYRDLQILAHEINHGVGVNGGIRREDYTDVGVNMEEALTEETAHLEVADWLRSYGMTDVLAAVKRNPTDWRVRGTYANYRVQIKKLMDDVKLNDEERRALLRRMKFQMTPAEARAELIRLAQQKRSWVSSLKDALEQPGQDDPRWGFTPVVRPDLSDIDAGIMSLTTKGGSTVQNRDWIEVARPGSKPLQGTVTGLRPDDGSGTGGWVRVHDISTDTEQWYALDRVLAVLGRTLT